MHSCARWAPLMATLAMQQKTTGLYPRRHQVQRQVQHQALRMHRHQHRRQSSAASALTAILVMTFVIYVIQVGTATLLALQNAKFAILGGSQTTLVPRSAQSARRSHTDWMQASSRLLRQSAASALPVVISIFRFVLWAAITQHMPFHRVSRSSVRRAPAAASLRMTMPRNATPALTGRGLEVTLAGHTASLCRRQVLLRAQRLPQRL